MLLFQCSYFILGWFTWWCGNGQGNNLGKTDSCKAEEVQVPKEDNCIEWELMCFSNCRDGNILWVRAVNKEPCGKRQHPSEWTHFFRRKLILEERKYLQERLFLQMLMSWIDAQSWQLRREWWIPCMKLGQEFTYRSCFL